MSHEELLEQILKQLTALNEKMDTGFKKVNEKLDREIEDISHFVSRLDHLVQDHRKRIEDIENTLGVSKN